MTALLILGAFLLGGALGALVRRAGAEGRGR